MNMKCPVCDHEWVPPDPKSIFCPECAMSAVRGKDSHAADHAAKDAEITKLRGELGNAVELLHQMRQYIGRRGYALPVDLEVAVWGFIHEHEGDGR